MQICTGETGLEQCYIMKQNKRLRCGYTTGSCAAAAAKAASIMLLTGQQIETIDLMTPKGVLLHLKILDIVQEEEFVSCAVKKDGGDDPDATDGLLIYARVEKRLEVGVEIDGGTGVGRITQKGLEQPIGQAAINRVPRVMITEAVTQVCRELNYTKGIKVVIFVPEGEERARKTFNPRLGIQGGISILGTSGIVIPMSEEALIASIRVEMKMRKSAGDEYLLVTPGNYGADFLRKKQSLDLSRAMKCSNFVGATIDMAVELGMKGILFVSHIGKFIKVSGGIMNTHSQHADSRAELMAAQSIRAGASLETAKRILETITTEEAIDILEQEQMTDSVMEVILKKIQFYMQNRCKEKIKIEVILFSNRHGFLGETGGAQAILEDFLLKEEM